jgi:D-alanyl-D-alanine carboxypeptidase/D-alanyl-D-alanine-endopeptidase (penicillin-binding protein 4)
MSTLLLTAAVFIAIYSGRAASSEAADYSKALQDIIGTSCARESGPGIGVLGLKEDRLILDMNLEKLYTPASNVKIITSLTALKKLKPHYTFKTIFYADGPIRDGVLHGNLYIKGFGDPDLVPEQVWRMATELRDSGLHTVDGDLVADDSFFDHRLRGPGWDTRWSNRAYHAPIGALSVNFNTVTVKVLPGAEAGGKASVYMDPRIDYLRLKNLATTGPAGSRSSIVVGRVPTSLGDLVIVRGSIPRDSKGERRLINISKPALYAATLFHQTLEDVGVVVTGDHRLGKTPISATEHLVHESRPLSLIVWGLNKFSNNFIAEQILKTMGAEFHGEPGTLAKGLQVVRGYMEEIGIKPDSYRLVDGSGLSPQNRLSPAQIIWALRTAYRDFELAPEFMASLGVMGSDGSLTHRLRENPARSNVRAKTGSLNGVSALSGYARIPDVGPVAFSILLNGGRCNPYEAQDLQDKILSLLLGSYPPDGP